MEPRQRFAARVLLVNDKDEVLLFRGCDPAEPEVRYWFTPGGGLEPDEQAADAAARELREETGLIADVGRPVHSDITHFSFNGVAYRQEQQFFLTALPAARASAPRQVRVGQWQVDTACFDEWEVESIDDSHWWPVSSLEVTEETFYPRDLVTVLQGLGIGC